METLLPTSALILAKTLPVRCFDLGCRGLCPLLQVHILRVMQIILLHFNLCIPFEHTGSFCMHFSLITALRFLRPLFWLGYSLTCRLRFGSTSAFKFNFLGYF